MNFGVCFQTEGKVSFGSFEGFGQSLQVMRRTCSYIYFLSPSTRPPAQIGPAPTSAAVKVGTFARAQQMAITAVPKYLLSEPGRDVEGQAEGSALTFLPS